MPIPIVSKEIIESIYNQSHRNDETPLYSIEIIKQMQDENPDLYVAVQQTVFAIIEKFNLDTNDSRDVNIIANMMHIPACVYHAIKQQTICDELENE